MAVCGERERENTKAARALTCKHLPADAAAGFPLFAATAAAAAAAGGGGFQFFQNTRS